MLNSNKVSPHEFFAMWKGICEERKTALLAAWDRCPHYTSEIFHIEKPVTGAIADAFSLQVLINYYCLDAVFVRKSDRVPDSPPKQNWVQNIRIAFEHENVFQSGLFQEVSHLLITRADLRVLVAYPDAKEEVEPELNYLAQIIAASDLGDTDAAFLVVLGWRNESKTDIEWWAHTYSGAKKQFVPLIV